MNYREIFENIINDDYDIEDLIKLHQYCNDMYYNSENESPLSDSEFDIIDKIYKESVENSSIGSEVRGEKVPLPCIMGSLIQVYENETLKWIEKNNWENEDFVITDKQDGNSGAICYDKSGNFSISYSRGNGIEGSDTTRHLKKMNIPFKTDFESIIRVEIEMEDDTFFNNKHLFHKKDGKPYENPRNYVSGKMNAENADDFFYKNTKVFGTSVVSPEMDKIDQLEYMKKIGFDIPHFIIVKGKQLTDAFLTKYLTERREALKGKCAIDGIVIDLNNKEIRQKLGLKENTKNPDYARKFKVTDESNYIDAEVVKVHYEASGYGYLNPRVEIIPVKLNGVTITFVTGHNAKFILDNNIGKGSIIKLTRSGDVIPYIHSVVKQTIAELPNEEDFGEIYWSENEVDLILKYPENNKQSVINKLTNISVGFDIPSLKEASIEKLYDHGVRCFSEIIKMDEKTLKNIIGDANGTKIFNGIKNKLNPIQPHVLIGKSQILGRGIGSRKMEKFFEFITWEKFIKKEFTKNDIISIDGFSEKSYNTIVDNIDICLDFVNKISGYYTFEKPKEKITETFGFIFTGIRDKDFEQYLNSIGGKTLSSIKEGNNYLICKDKNSSSAKMIKAIKTVGKDNILEIDEAKHKWKYKY